MCVLGSDEILTAVRKIWVVAYPVSNTNYAWKHYGLTPGRNIDSGGVDTTYRINGDYTGSDYPQIYDNTWHYAEKDYGNKRYTGYFTTVTSQGQSDKVAAIVVEY